MAPEERGGYIGEELSIFAAATTWAAYIARQVSPYLHGTVFELGAGQGTRTRRLCGQASQWVAIEPDRTMGEELRREALRGNLGSNVEVFVGTLHDLPVDRLADVVLYIDVLEHIESDRAELARAASRMRAGGYLIVLSPAHPWLFSPFDESIGHHRRYTARDLVAMTPRSLEVVKRRMLDSAGMLASAANRFLLRRSMPTLSQVLFWDKALVPVSRWLDAAFLYRLGKSVLLVWRKVA